jgi:dTDP-4-amino-4,6-dideoxygalactose transaminase
MIVPFFDLHRLNKSIETPLAEAFTRVMDSGQFILGHELECFESEFAAYCGVKHCIGVANGLEALKLLLQAYEIGPGDEVLVPANTFIATWLAVSQCGAIPVPIEPSKDTYNMDPHLVAKAITAKTRAILPVHLYGQPADMDSLNQIAMQYGLIVIEDAAQAHGARYKNRRAGSLGDSAATSFYPGKNLGALGDGGGVLTNNDQIAEHVRQLRNYGSKSKYIHEIVGGNSRLDEMQAAFLRIKLTMLDEWNSKRSIIANQYSTFLSGFEIDLPYISKDSEPSWHQYVIRTRERDQLQLHLNQLGISTLIHYPIPPYRQDCYRNIDQANFPITNQLSNEVLSLPISPDLSNEEAEYVISAVRQFF